jgi:putative transposase
MMCEISEKTGASIRRICKALKHARSSFYHARQPTDRQLQDAKMGDSIEAIFRQHRSRYGYRRILAQLGDHQLRCAPSRVRRIMAQRGLRAIQPRHFVPKTSDGRAHRPSPNLLKEQPRAPMPNNAWASDITLIPTSTGWLYLAVVIDLCSRRIVGWSLADHMRSELVLRALKQALQTRSTHLTIFHSDRGSQYASTAFRQALREAGLRQSMSSRANPYDNAWSESFFGTLKREMLQDGCFETTQDAQIEIFEYIEGYYNTHRKHSSLGYKSPAQFETLLPSTN